MAQTNIEKRELLDFVLSNCIVKDGIFTPKYRQPFDLLAATVFSAAKKKQETGNNLPVCQLWWDGPHSQKTFVVFRFSIRLHYATTSGRRWKSIKCDK